MTGKLQLVLAGLFAMTVGCGQDEESHSEPPNTLTAQEQDAGWRLLFDGKTTLGWRGYNKEAFPTKGWEVRDGNLVILPANSEQPGFGGDILTEGQFENFELSLEFKLSPVANSGIMYRVVEREGEAMWYNGPEFQVLDDSAYIAMGTMDMHKHLTGDNYDLHSSDVRVLNAIGEWNHARIVVDRGRVQHWLNGQKTVEYGLETPEWEALVTQSKFADYPEYGRNRMGHIGLQDHDHMVWYRNIKIRVLN